MTTCNKAPKSVIYEDDFRNILNSYDFSKNIIDPTINKYERADILGERISQLACNAPPMVKVYEGENIKDIALREYHSKSIPFIIKREVGNYFEYWRFRDLIIW